MVWYLYRQRNHRRGGGQRGAGSVYIGTSPSTGTERGGGTVISYDKLRHMLIDKKMTMQELQIGAGLSGGTMTAIRNNLPITLRTVDSICQVLDCQPGEILEYVPQPWPDKK